MNRRTFISLAVLSTAFAGSLLSKGMKKAHAMKTKLQLSINPEKIQPFELDDIDWQHRLTEAEYYVMFKDGTEPPKSSKLNDEKRKGLYICAACNLALFKSDMKYESGTGWPSFFDVIEGRVETKRDFKLLLPRTEYHCARCGAHQGHVFKDGPQPTGLRYCNNGVALKFVTDVEVAELEAAD